MKRTKIVLLFVGIVLIVFGALIPTMFKVEKDKLAFYRDMGVSNYTCTITISSEKDYNVNSAVVYLEDFFGKQELTKQVNASSIDKSNSGNNYVYTFVIEFESFGEYSEFSKVKEVKLNTNIGTRIASENTFKWTTPVMIITIIAGVGLTIAGISIIFAQKAYKKHVENVRNEMATNYPEINTNGMTDEQVLAQQRELKRSEFQENGVAALFGIETKPKDKICEYCGSTNGSDAKKCSSCGANLKRKK